MPLLSHIPAERVMAAYRRPPGAADAALRAPASSARLLANALGAFLDRPERLPDLAPAPRAWGGPARELHLQYDAGAPWPEDPPPPPLHAAIVTDTHLVGVEARRYGPFRGRRVAAFSEVHARDAAWGEGMGSWIDLRDSLIADPRRFHHLDAAALARRALVLRGEGARRGLRAALLYLHAEPAQWPDGHRLRRGALARHAQEARDLAARVAASAAPLSVLTYARLLALLETSPDPGVRAHGEALRAAFPDL